MPKTENLHAQPSRAPWSFYHAPGGNWSYRVNRTCYSGYKVPPNYVRLVAKLSLSLQLFAGLWPACAMHPGRVGCRRLQDQHAACMHVNLVRDPGFCKVV